jgi:hypothetical protein
MAGQQQRRRGAATTTIYVPLALLLVMLLPALTQAWAPKAPRPLPLSPAAVEGRSPQLQPPQRQWHQQQRAQGAMDRRAALGQKLLGLSVASPLLLSVLGGRPLPARAADENKEAAIQVCKAVYAR